MYAVILCNEHNIGGDLSLSHKALKAQGSSLVSRGSEDTQAVQAEQLLGQLNNQWTTLLNDILATTNNFIDQELCARGEFYV